MEHKIVIGELPRLVSLKSLTSGTYFKWTDYDGKELIGIRNADDEQYIGTILTKGTYLTERMVEVIPDGTIISITVGGG